jgi:hypothetical protein
MKHKFISSVPEGSNPSLVGPNEWNDTHVFAFTTTSTNLTLVAPNDFVACTGGSGGITITLLTAVGNGGCAFIIKKVDSGIGAITIATTSSQTIDGSSTYQLTNQWQFVKVISDGSNWLIWGLN